MVQPPVQIIELEEPNEERGVEQGEGREGERGGGQGERREGQGERGEGQGERGEGQGEREEGQEEQRREEEIRRKSEKKEEKKTEDIQICEIKQDSPPHRSKHKRNVHPRTEQIPPMAPANSKNTCSDREFVFSILKNAALYMNIPLYCDSSEDMPELQSHYFGTHVFSGIHDIDAKVNYHFHIKVATEDPKKRLLNSVHEYFHNDVYFYHCIDYRLKQYLEEEVAKQAAKDAKVGVSRGNDDETHKYDSVATLRYARVDSRPEIIVMDNLFMDGYRPAVHNFFTQHQFGTALKEMAKLHALSMAYRLAKPKEFQKFLDERSPTLLYPDFSPVMFKEVIDSLKEMYTILREWGLDDVTKLKVFVDHSEGYFREVINYSGPYTSLIHMDCSLNKFLFSANNEKMKFADFFHWCPGTPVYDISYLLFTRGHYHVFVKVMRQFLMGYYEIFAGFSMELGVNAHEMYPYEELIREWNRYHRFGLFMAIHYFVKKIPNTKRGMAKPQTQYMGKVRLRSIYRWLLDINYFRFNPK